MRTITETKTVYTFNELSPKSQQTAIDNNRYYDVQDVEWWTEHIYEDASAIADIFGLDLRTRRVNRKDGSHYYEPNIYFSGFSSQGDGACFEGNYSYKPGALKAIKQYTPGDKELHNIVLCLQQAQRKNFYRIQCKTRHNGHYYHSGCMQVECENSYDNYFEIVNEDGIIQAMRDFADWIYKQLEIEYDYLTSDEYLRELLDEIDNEYLADGTCP